MKKNVLFIISVMLIMGVNAQNVNSVYKTLINKTTQKRKALIDIPVKERNELMKDNTVPVGTVISGKNGIEKIALGSSYNLYTAVMSESTGLTANNEIGTIMFTHRQNYPNSGGSGYIQSSFSTDGGATWDPDLIIYNDDTNPGRYPSGVIYNPSGNTDPNNAYSVISGPYLDGSDEWTGNYFASEKLDGQNKDIQKVLETATPNQTFARMFMTACDDGKIHVYGEDNAANANEYYIDIKTVINTATFNSSNNNFDWTSTIVEPVDLVGSDGVSEITGSPGMAWSKDGVIGYLVYTGRDHLSPDSLSTSPIVYKSTNSGATWTRMAGTDFSTVSVINDVIPDIAGDNGTSAPKRPAFSRTYDAAVDANGNLHILCYINGHSSNHVDSLSYVWTYANIQGFLYDVFTTSTGWDAIIVDTIMAKDYDFEDATESSVLIKGFYDARPQICKTPDGSTLFYVWLDSDDGMGLNERVNFYPDVYVRSNNVVSGILTAEKRLTNSYDNYYMYAADYAYFDGTEYSIPITVMPVVNKTGGELENVTHYFLRNVTINASIDENFKDISNISQNYPNPCSDITRIDVSVVSNSTLSVELFDMVGRKVMEHSKGKVSAGTHSFYLNVEKLKKGIYFYTIKTNNSSVTKKMLVK